MKMKNDVVESLSYMSTSASFAPMTKFIESPKNFASDFFLMIGKTYNSIYNNEIYNAGNHIGSFMFNIFGNDDLLTFLENKNRDK